MRVVVAEEVETNKDSDEEQDDHTSYHHTHNEQQRYGTATRLCGWKNGRVYVCIQRDCVTETMRHIPVFPGTIEFHNHPSLATSD